MEEQIIRSRGVVRKMGASLILTVDKLTKQRAELQPGDIVNYKLWKVEVVDVVCPKCNHRFADEKDKDPYDCPKCGEEFLQLDAKVRTNPEVQGTERRDEETL